ncbi:cation transporter [Marinimicrobium agarilyticum]|uniref:cation transporter n=1 Tax=Marinimicrobium agarilyticum TaxID=306546 RepID=UPI00041CF23B|nr:cation transporter [Marinimicrobium agarilyticum]
MAGCCEHDGEELAALRERQSGVLKIVLGINAVMFVVIIGAGLYASSSALLTDSLDNLGDVFTYALSLWAVQLSARAKAQVAFFKGGLILLAALAVLMQVGYKLWHPAVPLFEVMGLFSLLALIANGTCLTLLWRHRGDDVNMRSVWECSRNDVAANLAVFLAAAGVWLTDAGWPDLLVAFLLALLFLRSAVRVLSSARSSYRSET